MTENFKEGDEVKISIHPDGTPCTEEEMKAKSWIIKEFYSGVGHVSGKRPTAHLVCQTEYLTVETVVPVERLVSVREKTRVEGSEIDYRDVKVGDVIEVTTKRGEVTIVRTGPVTKVLLRPFLSSINSGGEELWTSGTSASTASIKLLKAAPEPHPFDTAVPGDWFHYDHDGYSAIFQYTKLRSGNWATERIDRRGINNVSDGKIVPEETAKKIFDMDDASDLKKP